MASVCFSLFLIGLFALMYIGGSEHSQKLKEFKLNIYLTSTSSTKDIEQFKTLLSNKVYIKKNANSALIDYFSRDEMANQFATDNNLELDQIINDAGFNPFKACVTATIKSDFTNHKKLEQIKNELEHYSSVYEVDLNNTDKAKIFELEKNIQVIAIILSILIVLSIIIILFLINNTIKLALFSQRFLIRSMQLVGATSSFIQKPFIGRSFVLGISSGLIATGLLYFLAAYLNNELPILKAYLSIENIVIVGAILITIGTLMVTISTYISVRKYLKMSLDELY